MQTPMNKRSDALKHKPRGIIKWAPFNSLPEFTMQMKAKNREKSLNESNIERHKR